MARKHPTHDETPTDDTTEAERFQEIKIQAIPFMVPAPYTAGHVLTDGEAQALNQVYAENLRNNFAKSVKAAQEAGGEVDTATLQEQLTEYAAKYQFNVRTRTTSSIDPVQREAEKIARQLIVEQMQKKGIKIKDLPEGRMETFIATLLEKQPNIKEEAQRRVTLSMEASSEMFEGLEAEQEAA